MKNDPSRPTEADLQNQVIQLQGELADKKHELQVLSVSLERLRREKHRYMMSGLAHVTGGTAAQFTSTLYLDWNKEGRKEMFYLTTHSTHFIYGYMASDIW